MANNYDINYDDQRFKDVEADKKVALSENEKMYSGMINESDKYYQAQIDASKQWADTQSKLQQEQTDFALEKIEQEKDQAKKDYTKEQSGAYVDWQKQSNQYGVNAEQAAANGMQNTGWSESSQVSMYNTYQNRVATARDSYNRIVLDFNNQMTEARLQNSSILAEIAYEAQKQQLELNLQAFNHKNTLLLEQANKKLEIENQYYNRYQDVLAQINQENALAEQIRQYNEEMALKQKQYEESVRQYNESLALEQAQFEWQKEQAAKSSSSGGGGGSSSSTKKISNTSSSSNSSGHGINRDSAADLKNNSSSNKSFEKQVLDLGQGPISASNLAKQVNSGKVSVSTNSNGKTTVKYNTPTSLLKYSKYNF